MKPRSMANKALLILVMAKGMQKGFIFLKDCTHTHPCKIVHDCCAACAPEKAQCDDCCEDYSNQADFSMRSMAGGRPSMPPRKVVLNSARLVQGVWGGKGGVGACRKLGCGTKGADQADVHSRSA